MAASAAAPGQCPVDDNDEENVDPDRLAGSAIDCANRVELDVLDCRRMVF